MQTHIDGTATEQQKTDAARHRLLSYSPHRQVISRTFFSLLTIYLVVWAVYGASSKLPSILTNGGLPALASTLVLLGAGLAAFLDVLLNDVLPSRFSFYLNRTHRHIVWGLIAVTYMSYAQIFSMSAMGLFGAGFYGLLGLWAAAIATMDVWYEYNDEYTRRTKRYDVAE
jgi:hypothetical protein